MRRYGAYSTGVHVFTFSYGADRTYNRLDDAFATYNRLKRTLDSLFRFRLRGYNVGISIARSIPTRTYVYTSTAATQLERRTNDLSSRFAIAKVKKVFGTLTASRPISRGRRT